MSIPTSYSRYRRLTHRCGEFWALPLTCVNGSQQFVYNIMNTLLTLVFEMAIIAAIHNYLETLQFVDVLIAALLKLSILWITDKIQHLCIQEITDFVSYMLTTINSWQLQATFKWWHDHPSNFRIRAMHDIQGSYDMMISKVFEACIVQAEILATLTVLAIHGLSTALIVLSCGAIAAFILHNTSSAEQRKLDETMHTTNKYYDALISNCHVSQSFSYVSPLLFVSERDPTRAHHEFFKAWDVRNRMGRRASYLQKMLKEIILVVLLYFYKQTPSVWPLMLLSVTQTIGNLQTLLGLKESQILGKGRMNNALRALRELEFQPNRPRTEIIRSDKWKEVQISNLAKPVLSAPLVFHMDTKARITLVTGAVGAGKSCLLWKLNGSLESDDMQNALTINGQRISGGLTNDRWRSNVGLIKQSAADEYRLNESNCLTLSLNQLFENMPATAMHRLLALRLPDLPTDPDVAIARSETAMSQGQTQALVICGLLWKLHKEGARIVFLDEPERALDQLTTALIFEHFVLLPEWNAHIVIALHSESLGEQLRKAGLVQQTIHITRVNEERTYAHVTRVCD